MKKAITILLTLLIVVAMAVPVLADTEGPVTGSFQTTVPPSITALGVYTDSGLTNLASALSPLQTYYVKVSVTDNDNISDIKSLKLLFNYDSDGGTPTEVEFGNLYPYSDAQQVAGYQYTYDGTNKGYSSSISGATWNISSSTQSANTYLAGASHDFVFIVTIGEVAKETAGASDKWQIAALATDGSNYTSYKAYSNTSIYGLPMNWYGKIVVNYGDSLTADWGTVQPGLAFTDSSSDHALGAPVSYTSNGDYAGGIKAGTTTWSKTGDTGKKVTLKNSHANAANTFSLKSQTGTDTQGLSYLPENAVTVPESGSTADIDGTGTITSESGTSQANYYLFLSLSNNITYPGTYTGTIYYTISNRSVQ